MPSLRCGVVGVGQLGQHHVRIYADLPDADLVGIYDKSRERMEEIARRHNTRAYPSLDALIKDVDAVSLAVPTVSHFEVGRSLLENRKHVLVEKPIASTVEQGAQLVRLAAAAGVVLYTGHTERFAPAIRSALGWVRQPRFIEALRMAGFGLRGTDVSVIHDLMIHDIDLVLSIVGSEPERVEAIGVPVFTPNVDIANARICFKDGTIASLTASRVSAERLRKMRFFQADAYISVDFLKRDVKIYRRKDGLDDLLASNTGGLEMQDLVEMIMPPVGDEEPLALEIQDFVQSVQGKKQPEVPGEAGLRALAIAAEIVKDIEARLDLWGE
ncbi:MAG TPA: Gfo/Idh/MocA family oxidoreductase [bacterium]|nr:Gfo/Idh/MocA family oxidoreductase [bacterium]